MVLDRTGVAGSGLIGGGNCGRGEIGAADEVECSETKGRMKIKIEYLCLYTILVSNEWSESVLCTIPVSGALCGKSLFSRRSSREIGARGSK